jgi:acetolactate decarboxylase
MRKIANGVIPMKHLMIICLFAVLCGCASGIPTRNQATLTQVSTYQALIMGIYDGELTYSRLAKHGDFGIGTVEGIDGEMIALDGIFYQAKVDGSVLQVDNSMKAPFAMVHFFRGDRLVFLKERIDDFDQLKIYLERQLPTANRPYAFRIAGTFPNVKVRSVPGQNRPYPPLQDVIARQAVFEFSGIKGTMVGYWMPGTLSSVNLPGFHLHFISDDRKHGGHVLDCRLSEASVNIDDLDGLMLIIPQNPAYQQADFTGRKK